MRRLLPRFFAFRAELDFVTADLRLERDFFAAVFAAVFRLEPARFATLFFDALRALRPDDFRAAELPRLPADFLAGDFRVLFLPLFDPVRDDFLAAAMLQAPM